MDGRNYRKDGRNTKSWKEGNNDEVRLKKRKAEKMDVSLQVPGWTESKVTERDRRAEERTK